MLKIIKADGVKEYEFLDQLKERNSEVDKRVTETVSAILADVRENGDAAVRAYTAKFDCPNPQYYEVPADVIASAERHCAPELIEALKEAAANIEDFHRRQAQQSWLDVDKKGIILGQRIRGLHRAGVYVPGGTAPLPSSVLMNIIPAKIAGVGEIIMVTPPCKDGSVNMGILAAAAIAGVDRVFLMGGAQAIAALAYGTEQVPQVDKIVGPGNIYVATAKKLVYGTVDIDMFAGPSEILIISDESGNPAYLAADMMSQAEHDIIASSILLTTSEELAYAVDEQLQIQLPKMSRQEIIQKSIDNYGGVIICDSIDRAIEISEMIAPEHLELCVAEPMGYIGAIDNAGSVFLGNYSPEPLGDYFAGPNHVLPTSGTARFFSPLSVDAFLKKSSFISYSREALAAVSDKVVTIANAEGLTAHANSVSIRFAADKENR